MNKNTYRQNDITTNNISSSFKKDLPLTEEKKAFIDKGKSIPIYYDETKIVLLPRDPSWVFSYWDVSKQKKNNIEKIHGKKIFETSRAILRIYDVTNVDFNGQNANRFFDVSVNIESKNWYIKIDDAERKSYCVELGIITEDGDLIKIARSNIISMPAGNISGVTDQEWLLIQEDFKKMMELSGDGKIGMSSGETLKMILNRIEKIISVYKIGGSGWVSSFAKGKEIKQEQKGFWLIADAELIVYGATKKNAKVKVKGNPIKLEGNGTFHLRFALPDGKFEIPIEAKSFDEKETRKITINVKRNTE